MDVRRHPEQRVRGTLEGAPRQRSRRGIVRRLDEAVKRAFDLVVSGVVLIALSPAVVILAIAIKLDSPGPIFYRCRRVGFRGHEFSMLKFRKMQDDAAGPALTVTGDHRLTGVGHFLAASKLDELPQFWNVLRGDMSLVGPRPEDPSFVALHPEAYERITEVRPGITGLSQLAFAEESRILDPADRTAHYIERLLPQKTRLDQLYVARRSMAMDIGIVAWTVAAVILRRDVAVHRETARLGLRRRPQLEGPLATLDAAGSVDDAATIERPTAKTGA